MNYLDPITDEMSLQEAEALWEKHKNLMNSLSGRGPYYEAAYDDMLTIKRQLEKKQEQAKALNQ